MASAAAFPRDCLSEDEVISFFRAAFQIELKKEQLINPSQVIVTYLYEMILEELGVSGIKQPDLTATQDIENIERYIDFMALSNIRLCVAEVLRQTGYQGEFTLLDIVQPKKKKVLSVLSRLIHLWVQVDQVRADWEKYSDGMATKQKEREQLHGRLQSLQKSLDQKALIAAQCRASKAELEKSLEAASQRYCRLKDSGNSLHEQYRAEKKELVEKREHLSELEVKLRKLREETAELEALIVRSPEKVTAETAAMEQQVANKRSEMRRLQQEYAEDRNQLDAVTKAQKDLKPAMDTLRETFADWEVLEEKCAVADDLSDNILSLKQKEAELRVVLEQGKKNVTGLQNQKKKNRLQYKKQQEPLIQMNEDVKAAIRAKHEACEGSSDTMKQLLHQEMSLMQRKENAESEQRRWGKQFAACVDKAGRAVNAASEKVIAAIETEKRN